MRILTTAILLMVTLIAVPLVTWYSGVDLGPLEWGAIKTVAGIAAAVAFYCFVAGEMSGNNSQVDKLWSIMPIIYCWVITAYGEFAPRLVLMSVLVTVWGVRLTVNFALKGAYTWRFWTGKEDYRWPILRQKPEFQPAWRWTVFNLLFICGYQNALIVLFCLPSMIALQYRQSPLGIFDAVVAVLMFAFIVLETIGDAQQWKFQSAKWKKIEAGEELTGDYKKGFLDRGLWSLSRHPNYFAEQAIWVCFYFFSVTSGGQWFNWSVAGCLLLIVLFQGSASFSEEISAGKYLEYKEYQRRVPRFIPGRKRQ